MGTLYPTCVKTPKGIEEVEQKIHGLALKSRQVLIMIDGKRDLAALQGIFPPEMVPGVLDELMDNGFIRVLEKPKPAAPPPIPDEENPFALGQTFMINIAKRILGIAGDGVIAKIKRATTVDDLRGLYPEWRSALREAPEGLQRMKELENKLFAAIGVVDLPGAAPAKKDVPVKPPSNDQERLELAHNYMANTARTFLGLAGSDFIKKVDSSTSIAELRALFFEWREALRQSPDAKRRLAELESKLAALLS